MALTIPWRSSTFNRFLTTRFKEPEFRTLNPGSRTPNPQVQILDDRSNRFHISLPTLTSFSILLSTPDRSSSIVKIQWRIIERPPTKADNSRAIPELQSKSANALNYPSKPIKKRDRSGVNFRKRWRTLVKTGCKLYQDYGARIYFSISIPRTRKDFIF